MCTQNATPEVCTDNKPLDDKIVTLLRLAQELGYNRAISDMTKSPSHDLFEKIGYSKGYAVALAWELHNQYDINMFDYVNEM